MITKRNIFSSYPYEHSLKTKATFLNIEPIVFEDVKTEYDMVRFFRQTRTCDGISWDHPLEYGFVNDIYHILIINGKEVPCYSSRCGMGIHSFAYIDVETDGSFDLQVSLFIKDGIYKNCLVLPESKNIASSINDNVINFSITDYGDYTVCIGETDIRPEKALTLMVCKKRVFEPLKGYKTQFFSPTLNIQNYELTSSATCYYFKKGHYKINSISVADNSVVYFESGCYFEINNIDDRDCFYSTRSNLTILGRALFDFSHLQGGGSGKKHPIVFNNLKEGYVEGIIAINSSTWTMCFNDCDEIETCNNLMIGYRTFSDGIMLAGCHNCLVHHNFIRNGDDAFEVKATSARILASNNLLFEYNTAWTDKANAYGVIFESNANITDVFFRHNSVGFAQSAWSNFVACFSIQRGTNYPYVWSNIHFEDSEVYYSNNPLISIYCSTINQYDYGDPEGKMYGGFLENLYYKNLSIKRQERSQLPVDCSFSIRYLVNPKYPQYLSHLGLKNIYMENINYLGTKITKRNFKETVIIDIPQGFEWKPEDLDIR